MWKKNRGKHLGKQLFDKKIFRKKMFGENNVGGGNWKTENMLWEKRKKGNMHDAKILLLPLLSICLNMSRLCKSGNPTALNASCNSCWSMLPDLSKSSWSNTFISTDCQFCRGSVFTGSQRTEPRTRNWVA